MAKEANNKKLVNEFHFHNMKRWPAGDDDAGKWLGNLYI
jgi:hypothetical protein